MRESEFIHWLCRQGGFDPRRVLTAPGDDCAVLAVGGERLLVTADQVLDGVHFSLTDHGGEAAGRKAAGRAISDIAAMAGKPLAMLATLAAPRGLTQPQAEAIHRGLRAAGDALDCPLVGGDLAAWADPAGRLLITVTVLATTGGVEPVLRRGARPGDALCVTGALGGAWRTRRHLEFTPRVAEARQLAEGFDLHAMIDLSDGLATDLAHLAAAGAVGAEVDASAVPIHPDAHLAEDPLAAALSDGEDYELLFALGAADADRILATPPPGLTVTRIGTCLAGAGLYLRRGDRREPLTASGWEHRT